MGGGSASVGEGSASVGCGSASARGGSASARGGSASAGEGSASAGVPARLPNPNWHTEWIQLNCVNPLCTLDHCRGLMGHPATQAAFEAGGSVGIPQQRQCPTCEVERQARLVVKRSDLRSVVAEPADVAILCRKMSKDLMKLSDNPLNKIPIHLRGMLKNLQKFLALATEVGDVYNMVVGPFANTARKFAEGLVKVSASPPPCLPTNFPAPSILP